jgi:hypothetical protein
MAIMISNMNNNNNNFIIKSCFFDTENNKIHAFLNDNSYYYGHYRINKHNGDCILDGVGKILYKDNSSFIGYFKNNLIHGVGIYYYNNNSIFRERIHNYSYGESLRNDDFYLSYKDGSYFVGKYDFNSSLTYGSMYYVNNTSKFGNYSFHSFVNGSLFEIQN